MSSSWIGQGERAAWQRRSAAELAAILDAHDGLPVITWIVGPAGSVLAGRVSGLAPAGRARAVFAAWREALALEEARERPGGGGTMFLQASACRGGVRVRLTATVFEEEEQ